MVLSKFGRYEILDELGEGGMSEVYRALDPVVERPVALKIIRKQFSQDEEFHKRFWREAITIANLEHRAILPLYDFGEDEPSSQLFLVMRLMPDVLNKRIRRNGPVPLEETSRILNRLAAALTKAHDQGIVHRDIKPANILLDSEGTVYLADFGLAAPFAKIEAGSVPSSYGGSPFYMAPEQWLEGKVGPHTDIYQLGITLFEMLTGRLPYPENDALLHERHISGRIPSACDINPNLPQAIDPILARAMAKNPHERYTSPQDLANAVTKLLNPEQIKNRYEIREEMRHGRLGAVYLAQDRFENRMVALKLMKHELIPNLAYQQRFQQKKQLITQIQHPAIVPVYDIDQHEGRPYLAMQFMEGFSLKERFRKERIFSIEVVCALAGRLAEALDAMHEKQIVHGDIQMGNVLLDEKGNYYLRDFQVTAVAELTQAVVAVEEPLGYLPYMAPEQWRGEPATQQTDLYQFGAMLYELLTGQPPFANMMANALRLAIENEAPPIVTAVVPELPPQLDEIFVRVLAKEPQARFGKASEIAEEMNQAHKIHQFDSLMARGAAHCEVNEWEAAILLFEQALELRSGSTAAKESLEQARRRKEDKSLLSQSDLAIAEKRWKDAEFYLKQATDSPIKTEKLAYVQQMQQVETKHKAGEEALKKGDLFAAQQLLDEANFLAPNHENVKQLLETVVEQAAAAKLQARQAISEGRFDLARGLLAPLGEDATAVHLRQEIATKQKQARRARRWAFLQRRRRLVGMVALILLAAAVAAWFFYFNSSPLEVSCLDTAMPRLRVSYDGTNYVAFSEGAPIRLPTQAQTVEAWLDLETNNLPESCQDFLEDEDLSILWRPVDPSFLEISTTERARATIVPLAPSENGHEIVVILLEGNQSKDFEFQLNFEQ